MWRFDGHPLHSFFFFFFVMPSYIVPSLSLLQAGMAAQSWWLCLSQHTARISQRDSIGMSQRDINTVSTVLIRRWSRQCVDCILLWHLAGWWYGEQSRTEVSEGLSETFVLEGAIHNFFRVASLTWWGNEKQNPQNWELSDYHSCLKGACGCLSEKPLSPVESFFVLEIKTVLESREICSEDPHQSQIELNTEAPKLICCSGQKRLYYLKSILPTCHPIVCSTGVQRAYSKYSVLISQHIKKKTIKKTNQNKTFI